MVFSKNAWIAAVAIVATTTTTVGAATSLDEERNLGGGIRGTTSTQQRELQLNYQDGTWTTTGCPLQPVDSGTPCSIPSGFQYQRCQYGPRDCTCRSDSPTFICQPYDLVPRSPPGTAPSPKPPPPTPPVPVASPTLKPTIGGVPAPTLKPTLGGVTAPPVPLPGSDRDEFGCIPSAGYSFCPSLQECIRLFETDCPASAPILSGVPAPTLKPTLGGVTTPPVPVIPPTPNTPTTGTPAVKNPEGLCLSNGVGSTCNDPDYSAIACCTSDKTGAFFNACCVNQFEGISFGGVMENGEALANNEFDVLIASVGNLEYGDADCVANGNGQGCAIFSVPGNEPSTPTTYPPGVAGPCTQVAPGTVCPDHGGACTFSGETFPVCCPTCATGTYLPGYSCNVTLPDGLTPTTCAAANPDSGGVPVPAPTFSGNTGAPPGPSLAPPFTGDTVEIDGRLCPANPDVAEGTNCCFFLPRPEGGVADEASCLYPPGSWGGATQCRCPGQNDDEGRSDCSTIGWSCVPFP